MSRSFESPSQLLAFADGSGDDPSGLPATLDTNPAQAAPYPVGLSLDIALRSAPLSDILDSYSLTYEQYRAIEENPAYQRELADHNESLKQEGWSFRKKAQAQAEAYLDLVFGMVNSNSVPVAVRADLIKSTVKWAGLDAPPPPKSQQEAQVDLTSLAEDLKNMSQGELEMRVLQIVGKRTTTTTRAPDGTTTTTTTSTSAAQLTPSQAQKNKAKVRTPFGDGCVIDNETQELSGAYRD